MAGELTVRDHMTLRLAFTPYNHLGARESDALELLGLQPTIYHRQVNVLLERPDALAAYPADVKRLRRLREARRLIRSASAKRVPA